MREWVEEIIRNIHEEAQILDFLDKDFKAVIKNIFKELKETISKELKKNIRIISHILK